MRRFKVSDETLGGYYAIFRDDGVQITGYIFENIEHAKQVANSIQTSYTQGYLDCGEKFKKRINNLLFSE